MVYQAWGATSYALNVALLVIGGLLVNGPYALITTAVSADLGDSTELSLSLPLLNKLPHPSKVFHQTRKNCVT